MRAMPRRLSLVLAGTFVAVFGSGGACDQFYTVRGTVRRCDNNQPIPNASVRMRLPSNNDRTEVQTERNGTFRAALNNQPSEEGARLSVSADGYQSESEEVHHSDSDDQNVRICLNPATSGIPDSMEGPTGVPAEPTAEED